MYRHVCVCVYVILRDEETEGHSPSRVDRVKRLKLECHVNSAGASTKSSRPEIVDRPPPGESLRISPLFFREAEITDSVNQMSR